MLNTIAIIIIIIIFIIVIFVRSFQEGFIRRLWRKSLSPGEERRWYEAREHPGLLCADMCFSRPDKQACLKACREVYDIPTTPPYYEMRARGILAY